jgi:dolichol-phosphate mannosyltransferase
VCDRGQPASAKLSILVPVYNERATLEALIDRVRHVRLSVEREIIVVDDGSTDGSAEQLRRLEAWGDIVACFHGRNQGKGSAVRTGLAKATGTIVLIQDADLEYDPAEYPRLIQPILENRTRVVYGSRTLGRNQPSYIRYYLGGRFLSFFANVIYGTRITDEPTCYKVLGAGLMRSLELESKGFEFCAEVTAKVGCLKERIVEVPIFYRPRSIKEGKKIRWTDGVKAMWTLLHYRKWRPPPNKEGFPGQAASSRVP